MKVKVVKVTGDRWYRDSVGKVFDVEDFDELGVYWVTGGSNYGIPKEDAEVVDDRNTGTTEEAKLPYLQKVLTTKYNLAVNKNTEYGNSFDKIMDKLAEHNIDPLQGLYIRLADKFNRFETLLFSDTQKVKDESIMDTLRDLSNYVDLYMAWESKQNGQM